MDFYTALLFLPSLVVGLTVHEFSHAFSAKLLGDRYPESMGRVSLNPFRHLSLLGTAAIFLIGFGWGKPVEINIYNFKKPKLYYLLSSLAGPLSNLIISAMSLGIMYLWRNEIVRTLMVPMYLINLVLAIINLIPVPPLDGSKIWPCIIPGMKPTISGKWSMIWVVVIIVALKGGVIDKIISPSLEYFVGFVPAQKANEKPRNFPDYIVAPEGATDFIYYASTDEDEYRYEMRFKYPEPYPARELWGKLTAGLASAGWYKFNYDLCDPNILWTDEWHQEEYDGQMYDSLVSEWYNKDNEFLDVYIEYYSADANELPDYVEVSLCYDPAGSYRASFFEEYKAIHPEEFELEENTD